MGLVNGQLPPATCLSHSVSLATEGNGGRGGEEQGIKKDSALWGRGLCGRGREGSELMSILHCPGFRAQVLSGWGRRQMTCLGKCCSGLSLYDYPLKEFSHTLSALGLPQSSGSPLYMWTLCIGHATVLFSCQIKALVLSSLFWDPEHNDSTFLIKGNASGGSYSYTDYN